MRDKLALPPSAKDLIRAVAADVGKEVAHHIEIMYPEAVKAASSTFLLSVKGCVHNEIMSAIQSESDVRTRISARSKFRSHIKKAYRNTRKKIG